MTKPYQALIEVLDGIYQYLSRSPSGHADAFSHADMAVFHKIWSEKSPPAMVDQPSIQHPCTQNH